MAGGGSQLFGRKDSESMLFAPVRNLNEDREEWCLQNSTNLNFPALARARDPKTLYRASKAEAEDFVNQLIAMYDHVDRARNRRSSKQDSKSFKIVLCTYEILCDIGDFLRGFTGVAEMVKGANPEFGGLAYGTFMLLAAVAINKRDREGVIEQGLRKFARAFPRLEILYRLETKPRLQKLVAETFKTAMWFCREAIAYFENGRLHRLWDACKPQDSRATLLAELTSNLDDIHKECVVMTLELVMNNESSMGDLRTIMEEVFKMIHQLSGQLHETRNETQKMRLQIGQISGEQEKQSYLRELNLLIGSPDARGLDLVSDMACVRTILIREFSEHRKKRKGARLLSSRMLESEEYYSRWFSNSESSLLLLGGDNLIEDSAIQLNWLSLASIWATIAGQQVGTAVASFCQQTEYLNDRSKRGFQDVVGDLIYQLVSNLPAGLSSKGAYLSAMLQSEEWMDPDCALSFRTAMEILTQLLKEFEEGSVITIVIDRLDQCQWVMYSDRAGYPPADAVFALLKIVSHSSLVHIKIKLLLIMDEFSARMVSTALNGYTRFISKVWDQEVDTDEE